MSLTCLLNADADTANNSEDLESSSNDTTSSYDRPFSPDVDAYKYRESKSRTPAPSHQRAADHLHLLDAGEVDGSGKVLSDANVSTLGNSHVSDEYSYLFMIATTHRCGKESWRRGRVRPKKRPKKEQKDASSQYIASSHGAKGSPGYEGFIEVMTASKLSMSLDYLSNQYAGRFPENVQDGTQVVKQYVQTFDSDTAKTFAEDLEL